MHPSIFSCPNWTVYHKFLYFLSLFSEDTHIWVVKYKRHTVFLILLYSYSWFSSAQIYLNFHLAISWTSGNIWILVQSILWYPNIFGYFFDQCLRFWIHLDNCTVNSWAFKYIWILIWTYLMIFPHYWCWARKAKC